MENTALQIHDVRVPQNIEDYAMDGAAILKQVAIIQNVMRTVMKSGVHYGTIPGCGDKPTLLQPGAQKLTLTFRLAPNYEINCNDLPGGHREYDVVCNLKSLVTGEYIGSGVGCCSTLEGKYRYRQENTGREVPKEYWKNRDLTLLGGEHCKPQKRDGKWVVVERVEHDNPADYFNTVKKMAIKRALVSAVIQATAASDIFTQDIEDLADNGVIGDQHAPQTQQAQPEPQEKAPEGQQAAAPPADPGQDADAKISDGKVRIIRAQLSRFKDPDNATVEFCGLFGINKVEDLPQSRLETGLNWITENLKGKK